MSLEIQTAAKLAIVLAQIHAESKHADKISSARVALWDATSLYNEENYLYAFRRALTSLEYSVGVLSPIWHEANRAILYPVDAAAAIERFDAQRG